MKEMALDNSTEFQSLAVSVLGSTPHAGHSPRPPFVLASGLPNTACSRLVPRAAVIWWRASVLILIAWHLFERLTQTVGRTAQQKEVI